MPCRLLARTASAASQSAKPPRGAARCGTDDAVDSRIGAEGKAVVIDSLEKVRRRRSGVVRPKKQLRQLKLRFGGVRQNLSGLLELNLGLREAPLRFGSRAILTELFVACAVGGRQICRERVPNGGQSLRFTATVERMIFAPELRPALRISSRFRSKFR